MWDLIQEALALYSVFCILYLGDPHVCIRDTTGVLIQCIQYILSLQIQVVAQCISKRVYRLNIVAI